MFAYFENNYPWNMAVLMAFALGGQISEIDEACRPFKEKSAGTGSAEESAQVIWWRSWSAIADRLRGLALQLHSPFEMGAARFGLMGSSPERPCDDVRGLDAPLCKLDDDAADFLDRPADQERRFVRRRSIIFLGGDVILVRCRMTAIMAKASMTSET